MSTFKNIQGKNIRSYENNAPNATAGEMWYNRTELKLKGVVASGAWSSASSTINAKQRPGGCGTQTAGLACGGLTAPPASALGTTEEYNGSGWSSGGTLNTARGNVTLFGTQTAAVFSGKGSPATPYAGTTELYNGTAWTTNPNSANDTYNYRSSCGTNTAGLLSGGNYPPTNRAAGVEEFNGTSFSEGGDLPQKQSSQGQAGTQTAAINSFGSTNSPVPGNSGDGDNAISLEYNGSTWTAGPNGNGVVPLSGYAMGSGTQTDAIFAGGPPTNSCKYDGTTFTVGPALATAQPSSAHGSSSASATWIAHGSPVPSVGTDTQEFNFTANTITAGAWASGGALTVAVYDSAGAGTKNAGLSFGGDTAPDGKTTATFEYNGSSWSSGGALGTGRRELGGFGLQTAAVACCGGNYPASQLSEEYDGSSWTAGNTTSVARTMMGAAGVLTAGIVCGGNPGTITTTEEYDGTNWSSGGALPVGKQSNDAFGNTTNAIKNVGGNTAPANYVSTSESYDGTNWTSGPTMTYGADRLSATGSSTSGLVFSGRVSGTATASSQYFDGTVFATAPSLGTARNGGAAAGKGETSNASSFVAGGYPGRLTATEEFTGETTSSNIVDITTS